MEELVSIKSSKEAKQKNAYFMILYMSSTKTGKTKSALLTG